MPIALQETVESSDGKSSGSSSECGGMPIIAEDCKGEIFVVVSECALPSENKETDQTVSTKTPALIKALAPLPCEICRGVDTAEYFAGAEWLVYE